jgi:predicted nucleic acid-binding protein
VGVLLGAKRLGLVERIRLDLDNLLKNSFFLRPQLYDELIHAAGEVGT